VIVTVTASRLYLVGDLDLGTKGQRFVRRRHGVFVERDAAGSFGSALRRVSHGVYRCDTVFGMNPPRGELRFATSQQNAAARQRL
jgi:hypothetical protein